MERQITFKDYATQGIYGTGAVDLPIMSGMTQAEISQLVIDALAAGRVKYSSGTCPQVVRVTASQKFTRHAHPGSEDDDCVYVTVGAPIGGHVQAGGKPDVAFYASKSDRPASTASKSDRPASTTASKPAAPTGLTVAQMFQRDIEMAVLLGLPKGKATARVTLAWQARRDTLTARQADLTAKQADLVAQAADVQAQLEQVGAELARYTLPANETANETASK